MDPAYSVWMILVPVVVTCGFIFPLLIAIILFCIALKQDLANDRKVYEASSVGAEAQHAWCDGGHVARVEVDDETDQFLEDLYL